MKKFGVLLGASFVLGASAFAAEKTTFELPPAVVPGENSYRVTTFFEYDRGLVRDTVELEFKLPIVQETNGVTSVNLVDCELETDVTTSGQFNSELEFSGALECPELHDREFTASGEGRFQNGYLSVDRRSFDRVTVTIQERLESEPDEGGSKTVFKRDYGAFGFEIDI